MNGCLVNHIVTDLEADSLGMGVVGSIVCTALVVGAVPCYLITGAFVLGTGLLAYHLNEASTDCGGRGAVLNDTWILVTPWVSRVC
jgi:hypothetical protein